MARPWPKKSAWPYVAKSGRKSYTVGFYDHDKREHSRTFPSVRHARAWMDDYITAERRGCDSLRRFLLDLDAKEANEAEGRTIAQILELFLELDAHPRNEEGLAPTTYELYRSVLNCHLLGTFTAARMRLTRTNTRCEECESYRVVAGTCEQCGWIDPSYEPVELPTLSEDELARRLAEPCTPNSDISTFLSPEDLS